MVPYVLQDHQFTIGLESFQQSELQVHPGDPCQNRPFHMHMLICSKKMASFLLARLYYNGHILIMLNILETRTSNDSKYEQKRRILRSSAATSEFIHSGLKEVI